MTEYARMRTSTNHLTLAAKLLIFVLQLSAGAALTMGGSTSKTFEFGPGTEYSSANFRTFPVPCGQQVTATVQYARGGSGSANDIPIVIELRQPGTTSNSDGTLADSKEVFAKPLGYPQFTGLSGSMSSTGCDIPWRVRVRGRDGAPSHKVFGMIVVKYSDGYLILPPPTPFSLNKGASKTLNIGPNSGCPQGRITARGSWGHNLGVIPILMRFELLNPSGAVVATTTGHSDSEINPMYSGGKLRLEHTINSCSSGQWKLKVTNISSHDAVNVRPWANATPFCAGM